MSAYYNENDPFAAAWLRELIKANHITPGEVDERSIEDVKPNELREFTQCHFFAGIGGWSYALRLAAWPDDRPVWTGSCPCQPFSAAGKRAGTADERHLWPIFFHLIKECKPITVFGEQVASKDGLGWIDLVQNDLEAAGYGCGSVDLCAAGIGAPFLGQRLYFVGESGWPASNMWTRRWESERMGWKWNQSNVVEISDPTRSLWTSEPRPSTLAHGIPNRVGKLRGYGNAIVPQVAQAFIEAYLEVCSENG